MFKSALPAIVLALCMLHAGGAASLTIDFQEGTLLPGGGAYTGTQDTEIQEGDPTNSFGSNGLVRVDSLHLGGDVQGLLRFDNLFGVLPDQIPLGSTINSAVLTLDVVDSSNFPIGTISIFQMTTGWSESSTWTSLGSGVQVGSETVASADDAHTAESIAPTTWNVQSSLQSWSNGDTNFGWAIFNDNTDGIQFTTSEGATVTARPLLTVDFTPVPEPGSLVLAGLVGAAALCVRRLRRRAQARR
jgi:hypothetical protein